MLTGDPEGAVDYVWLADGENSGEDGRAVIRGEKLDRDCMQEKSW